MSRSNPQRREPITDREHILTFGKWKGRSIDDIMECFPSYLAWLHHNSDFFELSDDLLNEAETGQDRP